MDDQERPQLTDRVCTVCNAEVAAWPSVMVCHCHQVPWKRSLDTIARLTAEPAGEDVERVVERVARAICVENEQDPDGPHPEDAAEGRTDGFPMWVFYTGSARAAIAVLPNYRPLLTALAKVMPIRVNDGPDYAEAYFADGKTHSTQAMTMNPRDWRDLDEAYAAIAALHPTDHIADAGRMVPTDDLRRTREAELEAEVERLRGLLVDPGSPAWEDARGILAAELRKAEMPNHARAVAEGQGAYIPSWMALNLIVLSTVSKEREHG